MTTNPLLHIYYIIIFLINTFNINGVEEGGVRGRREGNRGGYSIKWIKGVDYNWVKEGGLGIIEGSIY